MDSAPQPAQPLVLPAKLAGFLSSTLGEGLGKEEHHHWALLEHLVSADDVESALVFTRTKHRTRRLAQQLDRAGHRAVALQGNMSQGQRERAMDGFRRKRFDILVATDIAARGIDVQQVSHVVNFDMPNTTDAYTHRIGRTGRSDRQGKAYTFVTSEDHELVSKVEKRLGAAIPRRSIEGIETGRLFVLHHVTLLAALGDKRAVPFHAEAVDQFRAADS